MPQSVVVEMARQGSVLAVPNKLVRSFKRTSPLPPHPFLRLTLTPSSLSQYHELVVTYGDAKTSILAVLIFIQTVYPNEPRPALEHVWLTKGMSGKREDIAAWWEEERLRNLAQKKVELDKETGMEIGPEM